MAAHPLTIMDRRPRFAALARKTQTDTHAQTNSNGNADSSNRAEYDASDWADHSAIWSAKRRANGNANPCTTRDATWSANGNANPQTNGCGADGNAKTDADPQTNGCGATPVCNEASHSSTNATRFGAETTDSSTGAARQTDAQGDDGKRTKKSRAQTNGAPARRPKAQSRRQFAVALPGAFRPAQLLANAWQSDDEPQP